MNHYQSAAENYTDGPTIESGGTTVTEDSKKANLSPVLARDVSSLEFGASKRKSSVNRNSALRTVLVVAFISFVINAIAFSAFVLMSPDTFSPVDASTVPSNSALDNHPGLPEKFIEEVLASIFRHEKDHLAPASNSTRRLRKRFIPDDQGCDQADHWLRRICDANESETAWEDECVDTETGHNYEIAGDCPPNTNCAEHIDTDGHEVVICEPRTPPRNDNVSRDAKRRKVSQYGYREIPEIKTIGNNQQVQSITLQVGINDASVSGFLSDADKTYVIAPNNQLNAHARGFTYKLCRSGNPADRNGRDCNPLFRYDLRIGSIVDYSYGLSSDQKAVLFYSFWGNG